MKIINQEIKTGKYSNQITAVDFFHKYYKEEEGNAPIQMQMKSKLTFTLGDCVMEREIKNTIYINPDEEIYKEILLHSKHIVIP